MTTPDKNNIIEDKAEDKQSSAGKEIRAGRYEENKSSNTKSGKDNKNKYARKTANGGKTLARLLGYIFKNYAFRFLLVLCCIVISAYATVKSSTFISTLIANVGKLVEAVRGGATPDFSPLIREIMIIAVIFALGIISSFLFSYLMVGIAQGVLRKIRNDMFFHMQSLPVRFFDTHAFGDVMSRYTNDTDAIEQLISQSLPQVFSSMITIIMSFAAMLATSWQLTIIVVLTLALMLLVVKNVGGKSAKYFIAQQQSVGKLNGYIEEMINGQKVIKVFCRENQSKYDFDELNGELCGNMTSANTYANIFMPIMMNLNYLQYVIIAVAGGILAINGLLYSPSGTDAYSMLGVVASFLLLSRTFSRPITMVSQQLNSIAMALAGAERIFALMDEKPETDEGYVTLVNAKRAADGSVVPCEERTELWAWKHPHKAEGTVTYTELEGRITLDDVDFSYVPEKPVLKNVTLFAEPGQKIALVGATGAGKTTITNLINRFYDIADGKVRYDGININKIKKADLRRSLGIVLQDTNLFTGTIRDNIRYGKLDATDDEIIAAAKLANADDFIERLPDGYDTMLAGDGANLSQGQRQLLSIARAAIADAPVMILDEATSSIDTRTELLVQRGTDKLMEGRTVFIIAHRLSTVKNADVIMVMSHGEIIERGNHESLIAKKGEYYKLYTGAFELD